MKRYYILLVQLLLVAPVSLWAATISVSDAQNVALNFFKINAADVVGKQNIQAVLYYTRTETDNSPDFYVFNIQPVTGFVIVSASDNVKPVLAYSTESAFKNDAGKFGISNWMLHQATHVARVVSQHLAATAEITAQWTAYKAGYAPASAKSGSVAIMCHTSWNQEPYYNAFCPYNSTDSQQCVTGCVATAMAQILKFWNYPNQGTGSFSYNDKPPLYYYNYGEQSADFGATIYDWADMPEVIGRVDTPIATLMYQCGVSVAMNYGDDNQDGSGAFVLQADARGNNSPCAQNAFITYFSYDPNMIQGQILRNFGSSADWLSMIETELDAGRPILYEGTDKTYGGHAWVADGYNANGVHMNWGWGGSDNGYYDLTNLDPDGYLFSEEDGALTGIQPIEASVNVPTASINLCKGDTTSLAATSSPAVTYTWTPVTGLSCATCATTQAYPQSTTTYTVKVDSSGYTGTAKVTVTVNPNLTAAGGFITNASCYGEADGSLSASVSGGTPSYNFTWSNGQTGTLDANVTQGTYMVTVTDAAGCSAVVTQTVKSPPQIAVSPQIQGTSTCTAANGGAVVTASGGSGGSFTYLWSNGATGAGISGLKAGTYPVTVTDTAGCTTVTDVSINQPYQIQITVDASNATWGDNGAVTIANVTEGISPYTFSWSNGDTTEDISQLAPGAYTVTVTDNNGCYETAVADVNVTTGVSTVPESFTFNVYPNPANANAYIAVNNLQSNTTLTLENLLGQALFTKTLTELQTPLNLASYPSGIYLIELQQGDKRAVKQLVISR